MKIDMSGIISHTTLVGMLYYYNTHQMIFSNFLKKLGNCINFSNSTVLLSKKGLTMPLTVATNRARRDSLVSGGGLKPNALQRRQRAAEDFDHFIQQSKICGVPLGIIIVEFKTTSLN